MTRKEYINALRLILAGINPSDKEELIEEVENHFDNGLSEGKSEAEICEELGPVSDFLQEEKQIKQKPFSFNFHKLAGFGKAFELAFNYRKSMENTDYIPFTKWRHLHITQNRGDLSISKGEENTISYNGNSQNIHYQEEGDTLYITIESLSQEVDCHFQVKEIENLVIYSKLGDVDIDQLNPSSLDVTTVAGDIDINHLNTFTTKIKAVAGDININNVQSEKNDIHNKAGDISIHHSDIESLHIQQKAGDISLQSCQGELVFINNLAGDISLVENNYSRVILETVSGDIEYNFPDQQKIYAHTLLGDISHFDVPLLALSNKTEIQQGEEGVYLSTNSGDITIEKD